MTTPDIIQQLTKWEIIRLAYGLSRKGMLYGLTEDEVKVVEGE